MDDIKRKQQKEKLDELEKFPHSKENFNEEEINGWVGECSSLFTEIGVDAQIVGDFIRNFAYVEEEKEDHSLYSLSNLKYVQKNMGPFVSEDYGFLFKGHGSAGNYKFKNNTKTHYIKFAFTVANENLKKDKEDGRIVPILLIEELKHKRGQRYKQLINIIDSLESVCQKRDEQKMLNAANDLLNEILNFHPVLRKMKNNLNQKLQEIIKTSIIKKQFGDLDNEFLNALDNNRIIRNKKSGHIKTPLKYNVSFLVAVSYVYLISIFLQIVVSNGKLIK